MGNSASVNHSKAEAASDAAASPTFQLQQLEPDDYSIKKRSRHEDHNPLSGQSNVDGYQIAEDDEWSSDDADVISADCRISSAALDAKNAKAPFPTQQLDGGSLEQPSRDDPFRLAKIMFPEKRSLRSSNQYGVEQNMFDSDSDENSDDVPPPPPPRSSNFPSSSLLMHNQSFGRTEFDTNSKVVDNLRRTGSINGGTQGHNQTFSKEVSRSQNTVNSKNIPAGHGEQKNVQLAEKMNEQDQNKQEVIKSSPSLQAECCEVDQTGHPPDARAMAGSCVVLVSSLQLSNDLKKLIPSTSKRCIAMWGGTLSDFSVDNLFFVLPTRIVSSKISRRRSSGFNSLSEEGGQMSDHPTPDARLARNQSKSFPSRFVSAVKRAFGSSEADPSETNDRPNKRSEVIWLRISPKKVFNRHILFKSSQTSYCTLRSDKGISFNVGLPANIQDVLRQRLEKEIGYIDRLEEKRLLGAAEDIGIEITKPQNAPMKHSTNPANPDAVGSNEVSLSAFARDAHIAGNIPHMRRRPLSAAATLESRQHPLSISSAADNQVRSRNRPSTASRLRKLRMPISKVKSLNLEASRKALEDSSSESEAYGSDRDNVSILDKVMSSYTASSFGNSVPQSLPTAGDSFLTSVRFPSSNRSGLQHLSVSQLEHPKTSRENSPQRLPYSQRESLARAKRVAEYFDDTLEHASKARESDLDLDLLKENQSVGATANHDIDRQTNACQRSISDSKWIECDPPPAWGHRFSVLPAVIEVNNLSFEDESDSQAAAAKSNPSLIRKQKKSKFSVSRQSVSDLPLFVPASCSMLFGGFDGTACHNKLYSYLAPYHGWMEVPTFGREGLPPPRYLHAQCALSPSHLIVVGGQSEFGTVWGDCWNLNVSTGHWTLLDNRFLGNWIPDLRLTGAALFPIFPPSSQFNHMKMFFGNDPSGMQDEFCTVDGSESTRKRWVHQTEESILEMARNSGICLGKHANNGCRCWLPGPALSRTSAMAHRAFFCGGGRFGGAISQAASLLARPEGFQWQKHEDIPFSHDSGQGLTNHCGCSIRGIAAIGFGRHALGRHRSFCREDSSRLKLFDTLRSRKWWTVALSGDVPPAGLEHANMDALSDNIVTVYGGTLHGVSQPLQYHIDLRNCASSILKHPLPPPPAVKVVTVSSSSDSDEESSEDEVDIDELLAASEEDATASERSDPLSSTRGPSSFRAKKILRGRVPVEAKALRESLTPGTSSQASADSITRTVFKSGWTSSFDTSARRSRQFGVSRANMDPTKAIAQAIRAGRNQSSKTESRTSKKVHKNET